MFSLTSENGGLTIEGQRVLIRIPSSDLSELPEGVYQYALVSLEKGMVSTLAHGNIFLGDSLN